MGLFDGYNRISGVMPVYCAIIEDTRNISGQRTCNCIFSSACIVWIQTF